MTSGLLGESEHFGESMCRWQNSCLPDSARARKPDMLPPLMSRIASMWSCGPPEFRFVAS
jgi:hypothetical protein